MTNKTKVIIKEQVTQLLRDFMAKKIDEGVLIEKLRVIEKRYQKKDKGIWFRFFPGDPVVTTVRNIENNLSHPRNRGYFYDNFEIAIQNDSLIVYFS